MYRSFSTFMALSIVVAGSCGGLAFASGWSDEVPVTQDPQYQYLHFVAATPDDTLYLVWPDLTDPEDVQVLLTNSVDRGHTWSTPAVILSGGAFEYFALAADLAGLHLLYTEYTEDDENEYKMLYHMFSDDGGATFSEPVQVGERASVEDFRLIVADDALYAYAQDYDFETDTPYHYVYRSIDGGENWTENEIEIDTFIRNPAFTVDGDGVHMVFATMPDEPSVEIHYARSADYGRNWTTPVPVSQGAGAYSQSPAIAIDDQAMHVVWEDNREADYNIMYSRSTDGGQTWSSDVRLNDTFYGARAQLLDDEEGLHVLWCQYHGDDGWPATWFSGDYGIVWYKSSLDGGLTWSDEFRVTQNENIPPIDLPSQGANYVRIAELSTGFCAVWQDKRDGNIDLYARDYAGSGCAGDVDGDGDTDLSDLATLLAVYGTTTGDPTYIPEADFNGDGVVDLNDLAYLLSGYGC